MAGVTTTLTTTGLEESIGKVAALGGFHLTELTDDAAAILESSTRGRFETKEAPDGTPWVPWSDEYDETRKHGVHSLLVEEGDLNDSIASFSTGTEIHVGSNLVYAAHHQIGGEEIGSGVPARPYLGVSDEDERDLRDLVIGRVEDLFQ